MRSVRGATHIIAAWLALGLTLSASLARADGQAVVTSPVNDTDFKRVCGDVLQKKGGSSQSGAIDQAVTNQALAVGGKSQKLEYCKAAEGERKGATVNKVLAATWMGVAGICAIACAGVLLAGTLEPLCTISNLAATGVDATTTANFTGALMSLTPQLMTGALGKGSFKFGTALSASDKAIDKSITVADFDDTSRIQGISDKAFDNRAAKLKQQKRAACMSAATSGLTAMTKLQSASKMGKSAQENIKSASALNVNTGTAAAMDPSIVGGYQPTDLDPPTTSRSTASAGGGNYRSECESLGSTQEAIQCALASDPSLPGNVASPDFAKSFEAGANAVNGGGSASAALSSALGSHLGDEASKLDPAIQAAELALNESAGSTTYASGGGSTGQAEGDPMLNAMAGMIANLQNQGGDKGAESHNGVDAVSMANQRRPASVIAEDRSLSIFDRVSYRYRVSASGRL